MQKRLITLILVLILALGAVAYAENAETTQAVPDQSTVLATVNGSDVTLGDISGAYQYLAQMYQSYGMDVSSAEVQNALSSYALNMLIQEKVLASKAKELGLDVFTPEQEAEFKAQAEESYENTVTSYKSYFAAAGQTEDEVRANTIAYFDEQGYTVDSIVTSLKNSAAYQNVYDYAIKDVVVTEDEVKASYDENLKAKQEAYASNLSQYDTDVNSGSIIYCVPAGYRNVKHILVKVDDAKELKQLKSDLETLKEGDEKYQETVDRIAEIMAAVQPKLDEIASRIAAGDEFQTLIDEYGEDGGMKSGPTAETGYSMSDATTTFVSEFKDAGMALEKVGDISEPVLSDFGFHIIRYDSDVPERIVPYEEVKEQLEESLNTTKKSDTYNGLINQWIGESEIVYATDLGTGVAAE